MGYQFRGFFCDGDEKAFDAALGRWPICAAKVIKSPFRGFGLRCPDLEDKQNSVEGGLYREELLHSVEAGLSEFSTRFPATTFAFVQADCFGGHCMYAGFVVRNGEVTLRVEFSDTGVKNLRRLLKPLGVRLFTGHFRPLARGYWDED